MIISDSTRFIRLVNFVEPLGRRALETEMKTFQRLLTSRAEAGWEIVDVCDDELHVPNLIYRRTDDVYDKPVYGLEEIPVDKSIGDVASITNYLHMALREELIPVCIIENPRRRPMAVLKKANHSCAHTRIKVVPLSLKALGRQRNYIAEKLFELQTEENLALACVIHGGLNPVLIAISNEANEPFDYYVDHAFGGFYRNQATTLADLIQGRSEEGWHVCGTFLDIFQWPCVIFKRETKTAPAIPMRSA